MNMNSLVAAVMAGVLVCAGAAPGQDGSPSPSAARSSTEASDTVRSFAGIKAVTRPSQDSTMSFQLPTQVTKVFVRGGQAVKVGDPLIQGDDSEDVALYELQKMRAESDVPIKSAAKARDLAYLEYQRTEDAFNRRASNQQEFDRAKLTWERSVLEHENAVQQQLQERSGTAARVARVKKLTLTAPFDGVIDVVQADVGQSITESRDVLRIVNVEKLWIDANASIDEARTRSIKKGDTAWVMVEVVGKPRILSAVVTEVAPAAHPVARTLRIRVEIENPAGPSQILAGDTAWVRFTAPSEELIQKVASASGAETSR
ncbi:MAG: efflux RND transporter periplasmic adaptor subunit [Phycisphaerales bacterium]